jgi:hypothetical protein
MISPQRSALYQKLWRLLVVEQNLLASRVVLTSCTGSILCTEVNSNVFSYKLSKHLTSTVLGKTTMKSIAQNKLPTEQR